MEDSGDPRPFLRHFHQSSPISAVRFLPSASPFQRHVILSSPSSLQIHSLSPNPNPNLQLLSSHPLSSPLTSLSCSPNPNSALIAAATSAGSLHFLSFDPYEGTFNPDSISIADITDFHAGPIRAVDLVQSGSNGESSAVSAGEDGRVNMVRIGERMESVRVCESEGLAAFTAVKWGSPVEFGTGGVGPGLQWWDVRRPGGPVAQFKGIWGHGVGTGIIHSIDIHPSRKHTCVVGGSAGTVFAWDLRYQNQAVSLAGDLIDGSFGSEIWEVNYDNFAPVISSAKVLPVMICSEDGYLAVLRQDEDPVKLLEEPCAINSFDIDPQNPSDVIVALEWESVGIFSRGKEVLAME